jgi:hypothetical protein
MTSRKTFVISVLVLGFVMASFAPSVFAIKNCAECTCRDDCTLVCYAAPLTFRVCDDYACPDHPSCWGEGLSEEDTFAPMSSLELDQVTGEDAELDTEIEAEVEEQE